MFENIVNFFKKLKKNDKGIDSKSKETAEVEKPKRTRKKATTEEVAE